VRTARRVIGELATEGWIREGDDAIPLDDEVLDAQEVESRPVGGWSAARFRASSLARRAMWIFASCTSRSSSAIVPVSRSIGLKSECSPLIERISEVRPGHPSASTRIEPIER
jgi:hypothetical protein